VGSGIHTQRASELRGEPNLRIRHERSGEEILRQLRDRGASFMPHVEEALDATAEEITEAEDSST
jgi:hypothetical protein